MDWMCCHSLIDWREEITEAKIQIGTPHTVDTQMWTDRQTDRRTRTDQDRDRKKTKTAVVVVVGS